MIPDKNKTWLCGMSVYLICPGYIGTTPHTQRIHNQTHERYIPKYSQCETLVLTCTLQDNRLNTFWITSWEDRLCFHSFHQLSIYFLRWRNKLMEYLLICFFHTQGLQTSGLINLQNTWQLQKMCSYWWNWWNSAMVHLITTVFHRGLGTSLEPKPSQIQHFWGTLVFFCLFFLQEYIKWSETYGKIDFPIFTLLSYR